MVVDKEKQLAEAVRRMETMGIYKPYINALKKSNRVCFYENYGGFWVDQEPELLDKVRWFEEKYNAVVYAITHEFTDFGEMYDFLFVSEYEDEWDDEITPSEKGYYSVAYVWNKSGEGSEFGTVGVTCYGGGVRRYL